MMVALLASVVAVTAMTGVAVADDAQLNIYYPGTTNVVAFMDLEPGADFVQYDIVVTAMLNGPGTLHSLSDSVILGSGGGAGTDIIVQYQHPQVTGSQGAAIYQWTQTGAAGTGSDTIGLFVKLAPAAPVGAQYTLRIDDLVSGGTGVSYDTGVACVGVSSIPEFTTIAIPAIAVLGLFLFFNKRKHKKD